MMIRTQQNLKAARKTLQKKAGKDHGVWEKRLWHLSAQSFACQADAPSGLGEDDQHVAFVAACPDEHGE